MSDHNEDGVFDAEVRKAFRQEIPPNVRARLETLFAAYEHDQAKRSWGARIAALFVPPRRWSPRYATVVLLLLATACLGAYLAHKYQFISEGFGKFGVKVSPEDVTIETAVKVYMADHDGQAPTEFHQLTTPIAYVTGPLDPNWGKKGRELSKEEAEEWGNQPKWAKERWIWIFGNYQAWEGLDPAEWRDWVHWHCQEQIQQYLVHERFSPGQKARALEFAQSAENELLKALPTLVAYKTPEKDFDQAVLSIWRRCVVDPMQKIFMEMRSERPLIAIRMAVDAYSKKHGKPPATIHDLNGFFTRRGNLKPELIGRLGDRPLNEFELMTSRWEQMPREPEWFDWASYGKFGSASTRDLLDGWLPYRVDLYFQGCLPYYDFTEEERAQIQRIRDETYAELRAALLNLAERKAWHTTFENTYAQIWDKRIEEFYPIFEKMLARAGKP